MSIKLTKKQQKVYDFIVSYIDLHGNAPSYRDICAGLKLSSVSSVAEHVDHLVELGALKRDPGVAHSLEVVDITFPETTALFKTRLASATESEAEILRKAAILLDIDLEEE